MWSACCLRAAGQATSLANFDTDKDKNIDMITVCHAAGESRVNGPHSVGQHRM
jgi:hypothetical protein